MNLTLRLGRLSGVLNLIAAVVLAISFGPFGFQNKGMGTVLPVIFAILFGVKAVWEFLVLIPGNYCLTLDSEGFASRTIFKERRYRWDEVNAFSVGCSGLASGRVVYNFSNATQAQLERRPRGLRATFMSDHDAMLPSNFRVSAADLAETMNQWRWRAVNSIPRAVNAN